MFSVSCCVFCCFVRVVLCLFALCRVSMCLRYGEVLLCLVLCCVVVRCAVLYYASWCCDASPCVVVCYVALSCV